MNRCSYGIAYHTDGYNDAEEECDLIGSSVHTTNPFRPVLYAEWFHTLDERRYSILASDERSVCARIECPAPAVRHEAEDFHKPVDSARKPLSDAEPIRHLPACVDREVVFSTHPHPLTDTSKMRHMTLTGYSSRCSWTNWNFKAAGARRWPRLFLEYRAPCG